MSYMFLHKILERQSNPPTWGFENFVADSLKKESQHIFNKIDELTQYGSVSQAMLVLGGNGDGKTLLGQLILEKITELNGLPTRKNINNDQSVGDKINQRISQSIEASKKNRDNDNINDINYLFSMITVRGKTREKEVTRLI